MPQALYLKYRPQDFDEIDGQDHVTRTLKSALALGRIAHAYLFTGPRGTGKTSTARILAKAVNCLSETKEHPCNECAVCRAINDERLLDLIEIDAASNTGVDDIRELREKVDFRPSEARFKVYIIDEAHMLSNAAFNALLKTLEEPPPHVIFVLATTEPNKIPATITSRCQRFDFRRATLKELSRQLTEIAKNEKLEIEPAAIELISRQATGSFRDGTSLLDQLMAFADGKITLAQVQALLGAASEETIRSIVNGLARRDLPGGMSAIGQAVDGGTDPRQLAREIVEYLRGVLLSNAGASAALNFNTEMQTEVAQVAKLMTADQILRAIRLFNQAAFELRGSASATLPLEMAFVESALETTPGSSVPEPQHKSGGKKSTNVQTVAAEARTTPFGSPVKTRRVDSKADVPDEPQTAQVQPPGDLTLESVRQQWGRMLTSLRKSSKSTEALLRDAQPLALDGHQITVGFFYELHKTRIEGDKHAKPQIERIFSEIFCSPIRIRCVVSPKKQKMKEAQDDPLIRAALNLGGKITDVS
jgi:DNA polymerase III subunit gamma/tau